MRRWFSLLLVVLFGVSPLTGMLAASDESRLPACCRRHGAHHCAMSMEMAAAMAQAGAGTPVLTAPMTCPLFPGFMTGASTPSHALAGMAARVPGLLVREDLPSIEKTHLSLAQARLQAGRGPPACTQS